MQGITGQYYDSRVVTGPRALEAAKDFGRLAGAQAGTDTFPVQGEETDALIVLEEWPAGLMFGPWFQAWAKRFNLQVED